MADVFPELIVSVVLSFGVSYISIPFFNKFMKATGIVGRDIMKKNSKIVADMGGPGVIVGFLLGTFFFIGFEVFVRNNTTGLTGILASLNTILIITLIGIFDVLTALMKQREGKGIFERLKRRGIPAWFYFFLPLPAAVPLMAINAGVTKMNIPLFGQMELGIIYPILIVPLAVLCCSNATNFLAGFNGLEAGMGFILLISLGSFAYVNGIYPASAIALIFGVALAGFLKYNWYPADVFPGDLTYTIGAVVACVSIIGNMEKFAIVCFTPWILEAFLKALSGFRAENFGILQSDGSVKPRDKKIRSLTHLIMRSGNFKEWHVSLILIIFEVIICLLAWSIIRFI